MRATDPHDSSPTASFPLALLVILTIVGACLRFYSLDRQSLWSDELFAVMASYQPHFSDIIPLLISDSHPPGYVAMMYWLTPLVGYSDWAIRLHACLFGIAWIPLVYWLGARWFSPVAGLIAAALIASSHAAIYYSQEARAYSMLGFFFLLNLICWLEILVRQKPIKPYMVGFILTAIVCLYLHYAGFVLLATQGLFFLFLLIFRKPHTLFIQGLIIFGIPLLAYSPWLSLMYKHATDQSLGWAIGASAPQWSELFVLTNRLLGPDPNITYAYLTLLVISLCTYAYAHVRKGLTEKTLAAYVFCFLFLIPMLVFYIYSIVGTPIFQKRYLIHMVPIAALLAALPLYKITLFFPKKRNELFLCISLIFIFSTSLWTTASNGLYLDRNKDAVRESVNVILEDIEHNSRNEKYTVLMSHNWFQHYLRQAHIDFLPEPSKVLYNQPNKLNSTTTTLKNIQGLDVFYYIAINDLSAENAAFSLRQNFKLLSLTKQKSLPGTMDIYKFSATETPNLNALKAYKKSPLNNIADWVAKHIENKNPDTYRVLMTHDWYLAYLRNKGVQLDSDPSNYFYYLDFQMDFVTNLINTKSSSQLFYIAYNEPTAKPALLILQLTYPLVDSFSTDNNTVYLFDTTKTATITTDITQQLDGIPAYQAIKSLSGLLKNKPADTYLLAMNRPYFEHYLRAAKVTQYAHWPQFIFDRVDQVNPVLAYVQNHPAIEHFYYLSFSAKNINAELATHWKINCQLAIGDILLTKLDVKSPPEAPSKTPPTCPIP